MDAERAHHLALRGAAVLSSLPPIAKAYRALISRPASEPVSLMGLTFPHRIGLAAGLDKNGLRALVDRYRDQIKSGVVIIASPSEEKVSVVVGVTPDLTKRAPAGQIVKQLAPIVGGGGGGRPDFAEAGGKDPGKIADLLKESRVVVERMLGTAGG